MNSIDKRHQIYKRIKGMNHFYHMDVLSEWTSLLSIATEQIWTGTLRNSETEQSRVNLILVNYHTANYWTVNIVKVHRKSIDNFRRTGSGSSLLLTRMGTLGMFLLTTLTSGTWTTSFTLWFMVMMTLLILWITAYTTTNFATWWWKLRFSNILRNLTDTWLAWFGKSFHTIFTTTISGFKLFLFFLFILFFLIFRMVLWIFSSKKKIFFRTAITSTCLASLISKMSSSLISGYNTNTSLLIFVSVSMFAFFTTVFVSDGTLVFLFHGLFRRNSITDINLIFDILLLFSFFDTFILPFLLFFRGTAARHRSRRWRRRRSWRVMLLLYLGFNSIFSDG